LARELGITSGTRIDMVTQAPERARQLLLRVNVVGIVPEDRLSGRAVLAPLEKLDLIEAFYDEYALPDYGIVEGRPIAERVARFEGLRVYAVRLEDLAPLQTRIEQRFGVATEAATARVSSVLGLGRNLGLALALTAAIASVGLAAALVFGFWAEVARKRHAIASLALLGMDHRQIALFPVVQALTTAMLGLAASFLLFALAARLAEHLFDTGLTAEGGLVVIDAGQALAVVFGVLGFVAATSLAAAWSAQRTDPAIILRDAG
jgi:putative ABC transport system permease protein